MNHGASSAANPEKGARYLAQLDQALCNASWSEIPELARKVEKHAPTRRCLTLAARSEAQIASASHRPTSASSNPTSSLHGLSELIPRLEEAIVVGNSIEEDAFIASVGLAEIHWLREDQETALKLLPDFVPESNTHSSLPSALGWMEVCAVKTSYIRAASLENQGKQEQAQKLYQEAIARTPGTRSTELRKWTERLLARACMHFNAQVSSQSNASTIDALRAFTVWKDFWQRSPPGTSASGDHPSRIDMPRRQVWHAYYNLLSTILQSGRTYYVAHGRIHVGTMQTFPEEFRAPSKHTQRADLKRVESTYESLLIQETQFPKASQTNHEVEQWVEQAMKNWRIFCGFGWTDAELGQGGKENVSRTMLDILYRAATKTFHSTAVLRELFHVHASLGEFDLAMHAFDSYVDIVGKGKARAQKTGHHQDGIDDDDTAVLTGVEAVRVLCRYGDRSKAEKAVTVGKNLQRWLGEGRPRSSEQTTAPSEDQKTIIDSRTNAQLKSSTLAAAYRAIGISQAQWARMTYDTDARPGLQAEALKSLRRAQAQEPDNIETCYALSSLLAETRDVTAAISSIRRILAGNTDDQADGEDGAVKDYRRPRKLVPLWHLLALCMSAKDQYEAAYKMCEAALEQFGDRSVLFGQVASLNENIEKRSDGPAPSTGLVDQMDGFEKEAIIQIKMTQLTFTELMDGPSSAVDMTDELLSLYARLFGKVEQVKVSKPLPAAPSVAPSRTGGTLRSIAGSIRPRTNRNSVDKSGPRVASHGTTLEPPGANGDSNTTSGQDLGTPVAITVTNEDGAPVNRGRGRQEQRHSPFRLRSSTRGTNGRSRSRSLGGKSKPVPTENDHPPLPPPKDLPISTATAGTVSQNPVSSAVDNSNSQQPLKSMAHNSGHTEWPAPAGHDNQPPEQDVRLPASHPASSTTPVPSFSSAQQQRHKVSVLVKVWLFIAELYIRAESLDDASGAIQEAHKLVESFEAEVAAIESSARAFYSKTWGGGSSVDELWADILSSVSLLRRSHDDTLLLTIHREVTWRLLATFILKHHRTTKTRSLTSRIIHLPSSLSPPSY
jgi:tetratricopeptide (TPR) repeat protein